MMTEAREITVPIDLSSFQEKLLDLHSVANVLTLLHGRLYLAARGRSEAPSWMQGADLLPDLVDALADNRLTLPALLDHLGQLSADVLDDIGSRAAADSRSRDYWAEHREAIALLFGVVSARLRELAFGDRHAFRRVPEAFILSHLREFLVAAEHHAAGNWVLSFTDPPPENGWLVKLSSTGPGGTLAFPPVLHDVLRDLVANARKYSLPGSTIHASIQEAQDCLVLEVRDEGRGIPPEEIDKVVEFGFRASNALDRPTAGFGAGLTKAYVETRRLGGRLWIGSEPERGTLVKLVIPIPASEPSLS